MMRWPCEPGVTAVAPVLLLLLLAGATAHAGSPAAPPARSADASLTAAPSSSRTGRDEAALLHLLRHDCGSCHGLHLTGGLGPPLTRSALQDRPAALLRHTILHGRPGTPMPGWSGLLDGGEVDWLVRHLKGE